MPKHSQSDVSHKQLVVLCREKYFKEFGHEKVFSELVAHLRDLEINGISFPNELFIKGILFCIVVDNLGTHCVGGLLRILV